MGQQERDWPVLLSILVFVALPWIIGAALGLYMGWPR